MKRGFGSPNYSRERARQVQQAGARALHQQGKAHRWTGGEDGTASDAGRKGGATRSAACAAAATSDEQQAA